MSKRALLIFFFCTVSTTCFAQDNNIVRYPPPDTVVEITNDEIQSTKNDPNPVYLDYFVDEKPKYPAGMDSLALFISTKMGFELASSRTENHSIHFSIIIEKDGTVTPESASISGYGITIKEAKSMHEKVLGILPLIPKWEPAKKDGKLVRALISKELFFKPNQK
ncbi:hypothetical protein [Gracilimonas sp.]|uniref:hypothetical protein n=1 Tax=Gracilimonas sp. TaxID=1974203 RepID=UPI003BA850D3